MQHHNLPQGSPEWHAHRAQHFNASDAPAMMGCSPYKTRGELIQQLHTGLAPDVDAATQRRFDDGHRFEALARPLAESILGEELYPVVGSDGKLSASFDGLTMLEDTAFEHKTLNDELRAAMVEGCTGADLPLQYRVQMEQQCMVSGAGRVLFMSSKWSGDSLVEERHCWYTPDAALASRIAAGWAQLEADVAAHVPGAAAPVVVAATMTALPSVSVQVAGEIAVRENFGAFEVALRDFIEHKLIREPKTDQDFADLDLQIKAMKGAEAALDSAEAQMLAQIQTVDSAKRTKDMLTKLVRDNRLMAEKLLATEKERRRAEIVAGGATALREHIAALNARLGRAYMPVVASDFAAVIKGKKNLDSMQEAVGTELARAKIEANAAADRIDANLRTLRARAAGHEGLFPDVASIVLKAPEDLTALVTSRLHAHHLAEERRFEAERERIRAEEVAKLEAQQRAEAAQAARQAEPAIALAIDPHVSRMSVPASRPSHATEDVRTMKLGELNARFGCFTVTAENLKAMGFEPVGRDRAAVLYRAADLQAICHAIADRAMKAAA